jgi:hypothetical protein
VDSIKADSVSCSEQKIETSNEGKGDEKAKDKFVLLEEKKANTLCCFFISQHHY